MAGRSTRSLALMAKCPACSAPLPFQPLLMHGGMLGGPHFRISCPECHRFIYLDRDTRNVLLPLFILGATFLVGFPSPISSQILAGFGQWVPAARAEIWAIGTLTALGVFSFGGRLSAFPPDQPRPPMSIRARVINLTIQVIMLTWMYLLWRGVMHMGAT